MNRKEKQTVCDILDLHTIEPAYQCELEKDAKRREKRRAVISYMVPMCGLILSIIALSVCLYTGIR